VNQSRASSDDKSELSLESRSFVSFNYVTNVHPWWYYYLWCLCNVCKRYILF